MMLVDTLKELSTMEVFSRKALAQKLNTSENMIDEILDRLKEMGYIAEEKIKSCSGKCSSCSFSCKTSPGTFLTITQKGKNLIDTIHSI